MYAYMIEVRGEGWELTYKANDILDVLLMTRDLLKQDLHTIEVTSGFTGEILFRSNDDENDDGYMSPEMELMWKGFFMSPGAGN